MKTAPKKILSVFVALFLTATVFGYGYFRAKNFLRGPVVEITTPKNGQLLASALVSVGGISKNISFLNLNGRKIFTDENGNWSEKVLASPGINIIEVSAKDRFGRDTKKTIKVILKRDRKN